MIKNILVALDDDDTCQRVFDQAIDLAHPLHANLHLLNVLMPERDDSVTQAPYQDIRVRELADEIIDAQRREIKEMEWLIPDIRENGLVTTQAELEGRQVPDFAPTPE